MNEAKDRERRIRELADKDGIEIVKDSGRPIEGRRFDHVVSIRLAPDLVGQLRDIAENRGTTVSQLLREGANCIIKEAYERAVPVFSIRATAVPRSVQIRSYVTHSQGVSIEAPSPQ